MLYEQQYYFNIIGVDGNKLKIVNHPEVTKQIPINMKINHLQPLHEEDEEDDDEDFEMDNNRNDNNNNKHNINDNNKMGQATQRTKLYEKEILEIDIPQAFSHFTYRTTQRTELVCDLQGVLSCDYINNIPFFELTDPCIHSDRKRYGRTDRFQFGVNDFFKSHNCNAVCKILGISYK